MSVKYIYENHIDGSLYVSSNKLSFNICDTCGDIDNLIGYAKTKEDALKFFNENEWNMEYVYQFLDKYFK